MNKDWHNIFLLCRMKNMETKHIINMQIVNLMWTLCKKRAHRAFVKKSENITRMYTKLA